MSDKYGYTTMQTFNTLQKHYDGENEVFCETIGQCIDSAKRERMPTPIVIYDAQYNICAIFNENIICVSGVNYER